MTTTQSFLYAAEKLMDMRISLYICSSISHYCEKKEFEALGFCQCDFDTDALKSYKKYLDESIAKKDYYDSFLHLSSVFCLNEFEEHCLILSLLPYYSVKYQGLLRLLGNSGGGFSAQIALEFFSSEYTIENKMELIIALYEKMENTIFESSQGLIAPLIPRRQILDFLFSNKAVSNPDCTVFYADDKLEALLYDEDINQKLLCELQKNAPQGNIIYLYGEEGIGKKFQVKHLAQKLELTAVFYDALEKEDYAFYDAFTEAVLQQGILCLYNFDRLDYSLKQIVLKNYFDIRKEIPLILLGKEEIKPLSIDKTEFISIKIASPDEKNRLLLWQSILKKYKLLNDISAQEFSKKWAMTPKQIKSAVSEALSNFQTENQVKITKHNLNECCVNQISLELSSKSIRLKAMHGWDKLILEKKEKQKLIEACNQVKFSEMVFCNWNFREKISYGLGVTILMEGPPGTGKTMAAQIIANELSLELYKINLSQIVSKYIGETEKNLDAIFQEASKNNIILFFDETDALFGKRTEVKDSHDKHANMETSFLLQKLEEYEGVVLLATNFMGNMDKAFFRRIRTIVHFPFPDAKSRAQLWETIFPLEMPKEALEYDFLGKQFELSGGNIKNAALSSAFLAASQNNPLNMEHIIHAVVAEISKQGKTLLKEDLGKYSYCLENE